MKVTAFNGSPRINGNTAAMIFKIFERLELNGIECEFVQLGGNIVRGCQACGKCKEMQNGQCVFNDDAVNEYIRKMAASDGIIIGSPTYFASVNAETKALIDRAGYVSRANGNMFKRKVGAAVVVARRAGFLNVFQAINNLFLVSEMIVPGSTYWNLSVARDKGDFENDDEGVKTMEILGDNIAWLLRKLN
jgi:multimeric flavodoxin WrbA